MNLGEAKLNQVFPNYVSTQKIALIWLNKLMDNSRLVKISKYLSKHLRHQPDRLGIKLAPGGWVPVDELLAACATNQFPITRNELNEVVANNDKKRFSFDSDNSVWLVEYVPPEYLQKLATD